MRPIALALLLTACGSTASMAIDGPSGSPPVNDAGTDSGGTAAVPPDAEVDAASDTDAGPGDAGTDAPTNPWFDTACDSNQHPPACGGGTACTVGFTNEGATGVDSGVEMHNRCSFACRFDNDAADCFMSTYPGGPAPPGSRCIPERMPDGTIVGVCAPP